MADDPTLFDPKRKGPPPVPDEAVRTDPDSPFAPPPPAARGKFAAPPPDNQPSKYDWGRVEYAKKPIANGPPKILGVVCGGWLLFTFFQLWVWLPEEIVVPGCPGIAGMVTLILAVYTWSGRNWARLFAMINAAAWGIAAVIIAQTPAYEHLAPGEKPLTLIRAAFEIFAGYAVNRPECVAYFELRKGGFPKW
ncbi:MAG: hypothetical protein U0234_16550 [Sandaracinus sp.]